MVFQGEILSIGTLLEQANTAPETKPASSVGLRHTAASNARLCADLLEAGDSLDACWRFGILQTLDDYTSTLRRGGVELAAQVFTDEPAPTGAVQIDAAFAALADHLAARDGWQPPTWAAAATRRTRRWYPSVPTIFRAEADQQSPRAFAERGIFITPRSLARA